MSGLLQELRRQISSQRRDTYATPTPSRVRPTVEMGERVHFKDTVHQEKKRQDAPVAEVEVVLADEPQIAVAAAEAEAVAGRELSKTEAAEPTVEALGAAVVTPEPTVKVIAEPTEMAEPTAKVIAEPTEMAEPAADAVDLTAAETDATEVLEEVEETVFTGNEGQTIEQQRGVYVERPLDPSVGIAQENKMDAVSKDDFLLNQIDEFRERARQLQDLLDSKQSEAQQLQTLVDERQLQADELGQRLEENQKYADQMFGESRRYTDQVIQENQRYADQVAQENQRLAGQVALENQRLAGQVVQENQRYADQIVQENQRYADQVVQGVAEENSKYVGQIIQSVAQENQKNADRIVQGVAQENQKYIGSVTQGIALENQRYADQVSTNVGQRIDLLVTRVSDKMEEISRVVQGEISNGGIDEEKSRELKEGFAQIEKMTQELKEAFAQVEEQLAGVKVELSDKIHSENVKSYRNVSDLFRGMEDRTDCLSDIEVDVSKTKKISVVNIVFSIISLLAILGMIAINLGLVL